MQFRKPLHLRLWKQLRSSSGDGGGTARLRLVLWRAWCVFVIAGIGGDPALAQPLPQSSGQLDLAFRGYAARQAATSSRFLAPRVEFSEFLPKLGLISAKLETVSQPGQLASGENYLRLGGLNLLDYRWNVELGDYWVPTRMASLPASNVYFPAIAVRGLRIEASRPGWKYSVFGGQETLQVGPRVPFRQTVPQSAMGATLSRESDRWQFGARLLHLSTDDGAIPAYPNFFPANRRLSRSTTLALQASRAIGDSIHVFGEMTTGVRREPSLSRTIPDISMLAGLAIERPKWTTRFNYARQSVGYLPVLGYFAGDRVGPFAEVRYSPAAWVNMFGSGSMYRTNLGNHPEIPLFRSHSKAAGVNLTLPWRLSLTGQLSKTYFKTGGGEAPGTGDSSTRQITVNLVRRAGRHTLRLGYRDLLLGSLFNLVRQRSLELEEAIRWRRMAVIGSVRMQEPTGPNTAYTLFIRGLVQANLRRMTLFFQMETGNDLARQSVFSRSNSQSTILGLTVPLIRDWTLQAEAFRNSQTTALTSSNAFLQAGQGISPTVFLRGLERRSVYFSLTKRFSWGEPPPSGDLGRYVEQQTRLRGEVRGFVRSLGVGGPKPAAGVSIQLENGTKVVSDATGAFAFADVPVGDHVAALDIRALPAEFDPGPASSAQVSVAPGGLARADLGVWRLGSLSGVVESVDAECRENVLVRAQLTDRDTATTTDRYTTTNREGVFRFSNLREGDYEIVLDFGNAACTATAPLSVESRVLAETEAGPIRFSAKKTLVRKPVVRRNLEVRQ